MADSDRTDGPWPVLHARYVSALRGLVTGLVVVSGLAVLAMVGVTCLDVILRLPMIRRSLIGTEDIVKIAGAVALATALPYTTAVKGHVAIEYFYHKLNRSGRITLDTGTRVLAMALFVFLSWRSAVYGLELLDNGQVSQTLQLPVFWVAWVISFCCGVVVLVIAEHLVSPGRKLIKP